MLLTKASQAFPDTPEDQLSTQDVNLTDIASQVQLMSSLHPNKKNKFHIVGLGSVGHGKIRKAANERSGSRRNEEIDEVKRENQELRAKQARMDQEMNLIRSQLAFLMAQSNSQPATSLPPPRDDDPDAGSSSAPQSVM